MPIESIIIKNHKSIKKIKLNLNNKIVALIGINNVGKSNILEAINLIPAVNRSTSTIGRNSDLNFNLKENDFFRRGEQLSPNFSFEIKYLLSFQKEKRILINENNNKNKLLEDQANKVIKNCRQILSKYFEDKYFLQENYLFLVQQIKSILKEPHNFNMYNWKLSNAFPFLKFDTINTNIDNNDFLEKWLWAFLMKNYVFSEEEMSNIIVDILKLIKDFQELKETINLYNFSDKFFYLSTSLDVYGYTLLKVFEDVNIPNDSIKLEIMNNCFSSIIYHNENYHFFLKEIEELMPNTENIDSINKILRDEFSMVILNNKENQFSEYYGLYPEFSLKTNQSETFYRSTIVLIKKNDKGLECLEDIVKISEGLRNKLILKLNLEYCRKYKEREIILLLDEPDRGLHINAILELYKEFKEITEQTATKIIYTTHSPYLLGNIFLDYSNLWVVEKDNENNTVISEFSKQKVSELSATCIGKMSAITGNDYLIINSLNSGDYQYVTVEGPTDWHFYRWYNDKYHKNDKLVFVHINGKTNIQIPNIFQNLNLKYISLYDNDFSENELSQNLKIEKKKVLKYEYFLSKEIYDLESLLKLSIKKETHAKKIRAWTEKEMDKYYEQLLESQDTKEKVQLVFENIEEKWNDIYG